MAVIATVIAAALVIGEWDPVAALVVFLVVFALYVTVSAVPPHTLRRVAVPRRVREFLVVALSSVDKDVRPGRTAPMATRHDIYTLLPALTAVVVGSIGMVQTSVRIGARLGISEVLIGTIVLAALTGVPNVLAAVRLARRRRGSAVVSEALNSNTLNLLLGLTVPAVVVGVASPTAATELSVWWLLGLTILTLLFTGYRGGLRRGEGLVVVALYGVFVATLITA
ncbi:MAG TPA: hypothetical protein VHU91_06045 [Mycobacteriales bacterium]|jgi:Ca2+/Na+ antiporter|nr:hypothetical protein [Mycobacteriales bacterium]